MNHPKPIVHDKLVMRPIAGLKNAKRNARVHPRKQVKQIANCIERFGFTSPMLVDDDGRIVAGHGRVEAAKLIGMTEVPVICLRDLSARDLKAYALADNKLALNANWDPEILALEFQDLIELDEDLEITGFALAEIDALLDAAREGDTDARDAPEDVVPEPGKVTVSRAGDVWELGRHRLLCGDARAPEDYRELMRGDVAAIVFTDPPYNVPIDGQVCGLGSVQHREFAMASGEMSSSEFTAFLGLALTNMVQHLVSGSILYVCMDWRHMRELCEAGEDCALELKNLVVWNKTNGGMGAFYRSEHELIFVFKFGEAPHVNSFGLGETGRYRTNVWDYPGISSRSATRQAELAMHPKVKPAALVADALRDCSKRADIVLDPFAGSGTTLIAAQMTGRSARLIEFDPAYCDTIIRRFEAYTGKEARLAGTGETFGAKELLITAKEQGNG
ncbi:DNA methyltransferase [Novosphingobium sp. MW5]|nr:DNA methyltransferase [Novosphingobium sp. MW5]